MFDRGQQFLIDKGLVEGAPDAAAKRWRRRRARAETPSALVAAAVGNVAGGIFGVVTILILSFYLLVEADICASSFLRLFPREHPGARRGGQQRQSPSRSAPGSAASSCSAPSSARRRRSACGRSAFRSSTCWRCISGIGELIPVVGPILAAIPALAVAATVSLKKVLFVLIFFFLQQQFENHFLVPKVMSRQVGVSPVTVIVALLIGGKLLGIVGAILAVPTAAILQVVASELLGERDET